jgi:putative transposase
MCKKRKKRNGLREIPEDLWQLIEPLLPPDKPPGANGRPRVRNRTVLNGILYVLRTGCQWKMVPREYSSGSTCHLRFQTWVRAGIFQRIWRVCLQHYDDLRGIDWRFQSLDSATVSAPVKGGTKPEKTRRIAANWAPSGTISRMPTVSRWRPRSLAPTGTT